MTTAIARELGATSRLPDRLSVDAAAVPEPAAIGAGIQAFILPISSRLKPPGCPGWPTWPAALAVRVIARLWLER
jgi:hypothetical protein